jgi:diguanylate cyclase (GGDEF)-like protein/PAS domain S-box-containing protein
VRTDGDGLIAWVSPSVRDALAWDPSELVGTALDDLMHAQDAESLQAADPDDGPDAREVRLRDRAGQWRWMRLHRTPVHEPGASGSGHIDSLRDIDREVRTRLQAAFDARHDALTGLLNRTGLFAMLDSSQSDGDPALVAVGIDNLRQINAAYTHTAGDRVLVRVAEILVEVLGRRDRVARSGDNEFSLLVPDADPTELTSLAVRLVEAGATTVGLGAQELPITISVGIALGSGRRAEELVRDASTALRQARAAGGHRWEFLDPGVEAEARRRLTIQSGLRTALTAGEIRPWFQPIVNLSDRTVIGYEALARWMRADGVVVPPDEFLPVAEQSDLIVLLDRHMLAEAMTAVGLLPSPLHVAANLSAASLADPGLLQHVEGSLAATGADPARVHLEVTETTLLHVTQDVLTVMSDVADLGITWWVDDFGTGYSSLAHLRDLPVRGLKLDRSFTDGVETPGSTHGRLAQGLAGLARGMGLRTVAEGVETQEQADALLALGWEVGQGWLYGRPGPLPAR